MKASKLLRKLKQSRNNVSFDDFESCILSMGFTKKGVSGSHHTFVKDGVKELINIQCVNGKAKPYQIAQFLRILKHYDIDKEEADENS